MSNEIVDPKQFSKIRRYLGKTQGGMALLLAVSKKAVETYEMGTRTIPASVERQALFLLASKRPRAPKTCPCWEATHCPVERRNACPAYEYQWGQLCWFINGTMCEGVTYGSWDKKMKQCRKCTLFRSSIPKV